MSPIPLNSCARAATAAEARYRINVPIAGRRGARVVALDDAAATVVRRVARQEWHGARFFTVRLDASTSTGGGDADIGLRCTDGTNAHLQEELTGADVVVMVSGAAGHAPAALAIGQSCARRGIMTAGVVLGDRDEVRDVVAALRPHARVLLLTTDEQDVAEVLTALRA